MRNATPTSSRRWWLLGVVALIVAVAFASTRTNDPSTWDATAIVGAESFEINRARIPRTAAALVRRSSAGLGDNVSVIPVEETGLVTVTATGDTAERAEAMLVTLLPVVIHDLNRVGPDVGTFGQITDVTTRRSPSTRGPLDTFLFALVGLSSLSLSAIRFRAVQRVDGTAPRD